MQSVSQCLTPFAHMEEEIVVQKPAEHEVVHYLADEEQHRLISQKLFWASEVIWAFSLYKLDSIQMQHEY